MANRSSNGIAYRNTLQFPSDAALPTRAVLALRGSDAVDMSWRKITKPLCPAREERDPAHRCESVHRLAVRAIFRRPGRLPGGWTLRL